jgi:SAM-dependent methyltransferase
MREPVRDHPENLPMSALKQRIIARIKRNRWIRERFEQFRDPDVALSRCTQVFDRFTDGVGNRLDLIAGLRDRIKPGWQTMLVPKSGYALPDKMEVEDRLEHARRAVSSLAEALRKFSPGLAGRRVLEIGCYDGSSTYGLAAAGAGEVVGSDISRYYVNQSVEGADTPAQNAGTNAYLDSLRQIYARAFGFSAAGGDRRDPKVGFVEDNIVSSRLPSASFDVICSWESLEHITNIPEAFRQIHRLLRPGGVAYHEYNPFFSLNGGHSLCTLDFVWGHARLREEDFVRYLDAFRPGEKELALRFYRENLNRMTLADLAAHAAGAGLETLALVPLTRKSHWQLLTRECIEQAGRIYGTLTPMDFVSPMVWAVHRRRAP